MKYLLALLSFSLCLPILAAVDGESTAGGLAVETDPVWTSVSNNYATGEHTVNTDDQTADEVSVVTPFDGNLTPGATSVEAALQEVDNFVLGVTDGYIGDVQTHTAGGSLDMAENSILSVSTITVDTIKGEEPISGDSPDVTITTGTPADNSGDLILRTSDAINLRAGDVNIFPGLSGGTFNGGDVNITGGNTFEAAYVGGSVILTPGTNTQNGNAGRVIATFDATQNDDIVNWQVLTNQIAVLGGGGGGADGYIGDVQAHTAGGSLDMAGNEISNASTVTVTGTGSDIVFYSENFDSVNLLTKNFVGSDPEIVTDDETWQYSDFDPNIWQNIGGVLQVSYVGSLADNGSTAQGYGPAALCLNLKERGFRRDHGALRVKFDYTHSRTINSGSDVLQAFIYLLKYGENATGSKNLSNLAAGRAGNMWTQDAVNGNVAGGLDYNWHVYNMTSSDGSNDPAAPDGNFTVQPPGHRLQSYQIPLTTLSASGTVDLTLDLSNLDLSGGAQTLPVVNSLYTTGDAVNNGEYEIVNAGGNVDSFMGTPSLADFDYIQVAIAMRDNTGNAPSIVFDATATIDNLELMAVSTSGNLELTGVGASEEFTVVKTLNANVAEPITDFNAEGIIRVPVDQYPVVKYVQTGNIVFDWFSTAPADLAECVILLETDLGGSAIDFGTITWASGGPPTYGPATLNMFHVRVHNGVVKAVDIGAF